MANEKKSAPDRGMTEEEYRAAHVCYSVPAYQLKRNEKKLERARKQRDEWRGKFEVMQAEFKRCVSVWWESERKRQHDIASSVIRGHAAEIEKLEAKIERINARYVEVDTERRALAEAERLRKRDENAAWLEREQAKGGAAAELGGAS